MNTATISARNPLRYRVGQVLAAVSPGIRSRQEAQFTIPGISDGRHGVIEQLVRYYLGHRHIAQPRSLERMHRRFWEQQTPEDWYRFGAARHKTRHIPIFGPIVAGLGETLKARRINRVVEFGCGDGRWLAWLSEQWNGAADFLGVDLSTAQVAANRRRYPDLSFAAADLVEWAEAHAEPNSLFLTNCGVLEYLSQDSIDRLLTTLARRAPDSLVCFVEPIAEDLDLSCSDRVSTPHGGEFSWSHHYPARLKAAGLWGLDRQEREMDGFRMLVTIGQTPSTAHFAAD